MKKKIDSVKCNQRLNTRQDYSTNKERKINLKDTRGSYG